MNTFTRMSERGQVVVPKATRHRLGWQSGTDLEVIEHNDSVTLRPRHRVKTLSPAEAVERFRKLYTHRGPAVSIADMDAAIMEEVGRHAQERG